MTRICFVPHGVTLPHIKNQDLFCTIWYDSGDTKNQVLFPTRWCDTCETNNNILLYAVSYVNSARKTQKLEGISHQDKQCIDIEDTFPRVIK